MEGGAGMAAKGLGPRLQEEDDPFGSRFDPFGGAAGGMKEDKERVPDMPRDQAPGDLDYGQQQEGGFVWEGASRRTDREREVSDRINNRFTGPPPDIRGRNGAPADQMASISRTAVATGGDRFKGREGDRRQEER
jgi:hypothetical protein